MPGCLAQPRGGPVISTGTPRTMSKSHPRPWHRGSVFGPGPRRPLDRNQRARFRYLLALHARENRISSKCEKVGLALLKRHGPDGRCDPTQATLAADAGCKERTVRRCQRSAFRAEAADLAATHRSGRVAGFANLNRLRIAALGSGLYPRSAASFLRRTECPSNQFS